jgi:hypothetical protein
MARNSFESITERKSGEGGNHLDSTFPLFIMVTAPERKRSVDAPTVERPGADCRPQSAHPSGLVYLAQVRENESW